MTIQESTICSLVQTFPILLILAQNHNRCLKTPLIYKPPTPTPSPEYYAALDALFQNLFGHGAHGGDTHGCGYGYGKKLTYGQHSTSPCYTYAYPSTGHDFSHYGHGTYTPHSYPGMVYHGYSGYPSYGYKKVAAYNISGGHGYKGTYAPTQVYNLNHKYKVVIKKNKNRRPHKLQIKQKYNEQGLPVWEAGRHINVKIPENYVTEDRSSMVTNNNIKCNKKTDDEKSVGSMVEDYTSSTVDPCRNKSDHSSHESAANLSPAIRIVTQASNLGANGIKSRDNVRQSVEHCEVQGRHGECVVLRNCEPYLRVLLKQQGKPKPVLTQFFRKAHCGFDGKQPKVCCPPQRERTGINTQGSEKSSTNFTAETERSNENETLDSQFASISDNSHGTETPDHSKTKATENANDGTSGEVENSQAQVDKSDYVSNFPEPPVCGTSNATMTRVVGGIDAKLGDFPWMAILGYKKRRFTNWACGGSLITKKHVLTAAHCIHGLEKSLYVVRLGELDLIEEHEGATPYDVLIKKMMKHEEYSSNSYENDIGVLLMEKDIQFTELIRPICLPLSSELVSNTFENYNPIAAGWGMLRANGPPATLLQAVQLPVVSNKVCQDAYRSHIDVLKIDERILCAGYKEGGKDTCRGDSGGPLMQPIWNKSMKRTFYYEIGVVSFGMKNCAEAGVPGVYTRVTQFIPWIEEKILGPISIRH